jgi:ribosomal protein S18 acetylase RimI-like enzyme
MPLVIQTTRQPTIEDVDFLVHGLSQEAAIQRGLKPLQPYGFFLKNEKGQTVGGICGYCYYGCLAIDGLYIDLAYRGQGWGRKLLEAAESFGHDQNAAIFSVNTMDWEAKGFYEHQGYYVEFTRTGFENDSILYYMRKG